MIGVVNEWKQKCPETKGAIDLVACILFYERLEQTVKCIRSLLPSGVKVCVLNNGSSQASRQALGRLFGGYEQVRIFDSDVNLGVGVGRNYLLAHTSEDWILFLDNDIVIKTRDWVDRISRHIVSGRGIEAFIPRLWNAYEHRYMPYPSFDVAWPGKLGVIESIDGAINWFPGGAACVKRTVFERLGLYDEKMFVGFEDLEFGIRGIRSGNPVRGRLIYDIELVHKHVRAKTGADREAVLTRYNADLLEASANRLHEKHNVRCHGGLRSWAMEHLEYSLAERNIFFGMRWIVGLLKGRVLRQYPLGRLFKRIKSGITS